MELIHYEQTLNSMEKIVDFGIVKVPDGRRP